MDHLARQTIVAVVSRQMMRGCGGSVAQTVIDFIGHGAKACRK
jgi:hypothetical protein